MTQAVGNSLNTILAIPKPIDEKLEQSAASNCKLTSRISASSIIIEQSAVREPPPKPPNRQASKGNSAPLEDESYSKHDVQEPLRQQNQQSANETSQIDTVARETLKRLENELDRLENELDTVARETLKRLENELVSQRLENEFVILREQVKKQAEEISLKAREISLLEEKISLLEEKISLQAEQISLLIAQHQIPLLIAQHQSLQGQQSVASNPEGF